MHPQHKTDLAAPNLPSKSVLSQRGVLVVGDVMLDRYWFGDVDRISPEAPVPVVKVKNKQDRLGGAANVALNIQTLGAQSTLLSMVGNDDPATRLKALLEAQGVKAILGRDDSLTTIVKLRVIGRSQQLLRIDFEEEPNHEVLGQMLGDFNEALPDHDVVLFSDYGKGGLAHIPTMIEAARKAGKQVLVDPKGSDYERYTGASMITPNRSELALVVGQWHNEDELIKKAQTLRKRLHLDHLLLTRSEDGMTLFSEDGTHHVNAQAREVFDVTGAGDTVIAAMAVMLSSGMSPAAAMQIANRAGGIVVGKFGTACVSYEELST